MECLDELCRGYSSTVSCCIYSSCYIFIVIFILYKLSPLTEPDGNEAAEAGQGGRRISRMFSNNAVVKFFSGVKSIDRTTIKIHNVYLLMIANNFIFSFL